MLMLAVVNTPTIALEGSFVNTDTTTNYATLQEAIDAATAGDTITFTGEQENNATVKIDKAITIKGGVGAVIKQVTDIKSTGSSSKHSILILSDGVTLEDLTINADNMSYGVQAYLADAVTLNNVTILGSFGAGLTVNGSNVTADNLVISGSGWGSVNIDPGSVVTEPSKLTVNGTYGLNDKLEIWSDGKYVADTATVEVVGDNLVKTGSESSKLVTWSYKPFVVVGKDAYATLQEAIDEVGENETVKLMANASGNGVKVISDKKFTLDLNEYTYTIDGATVGSPGTQTNGFQLLRDSDITIKNGSIVSEKAKILIQNYSNLTLDNVTLTGGTATSYVLSNNNGSTILKNRTTINATEGKFAFDAYYWPSGKYPSVTVEIATSDVVINGPIEYAHDGTDTENFAKNAKIYIPLGYELEAPEGYAWVIQSGKQLLRATDTIVYTVTFEDYDGELIETQEVDYGEAAVAPANPSREGYTFVKWDTDFSKVPRSSHCYCCL